MKELALKIRMVVIQNQKPSRIYMAMTVSFLFRYYPENWIYQF